VTEINVEQSLNQLEEIVSKLESDEVALDEALQWFERGVKLSEQVRKKLTDSELKIKQVLEEAGGFSLEEFQL